MRYAIIADIHANLEAFTAVLDGIKRRGGFDEVWCLGDVVGYGPDPHECIALLRQTKHICIAGNHDRAAIGKLDTSDFNPDAAAASHWTSQQLTPEDIEYLEGLPVITEKEDFTLVHGSPSQPIWEYLLTPSAAKENFAYFKTRYCLVGHSHVPRVFEYRDGNVHYSSQFSSDAGLVLGETRLIINPGGVGQPRDGDPRASYAIYDRETSVIRLYRTPYKIGVTQAKMVKHKLPLRLAVRLSYGL